MSLLERYFCSSCVGYCAELAEDLVEEYGNDYKKIKEELEKYPIELSKEFFEFRFRLKELLKSSAYNRVFDESFYEKPDLRLLQEKYEKYSENDQVDLILEVYSKALELLLFSSDEELRNLIKNSSNFTIFSNEDLSLTSEFLKRIDQLDTKLTENKKRKKHLKR